MKKLSGLLVAIGPLLLAAAFFWTSGASGESGFYTSYCQGCHGSTSTCDGCHAHGVHSSDAKDDINITGETNKASYAPGETVSVTINGGYRRGWVRAILYDQNMVELKRSTGTVAGGATAPCCGSGYPITLTAAAPTAPGNYTWNVAWYGNKYDLTDAGSGATFFGPRWTLDATNPNHGQEIVSTNSFTVAASATPAISLNPSFLNFSTVVNTTATLTTQVQNTGNALLNITSIARCAGTSTVYTWTPSAPISVSAGSSQTLSVTYAPLAAGTDTGCLQLFSNDPTTNPATLNLSGNAVVLLPVRISGTVPTYFASLQSAYDVPPNGAPDGSIIQAKAVILPDTLVNFTRAVTVTLQGGYNVGYTSITGFTTILGTFTITSGTVIVENFVISS